eukprot:scaffold6178_cov143-Skeletonema_menzelii.AAC.11
MGQCHSDSDVNSHSGTSLPPTNSASCGTGAVSSQRAKPGSSVSYSPPVLLTPRHRNLFVSREVFTTLSPPQSPNPDIVVRRRKIKVEEKNLPTNATMSTMRTFKESMLIDVLDIPSKLSIPGITVAEKDQVSQPIIPFQKTFKRDSPLAANQTKESVLQAEDDQKVKMIEPAATPTPQMADEGEAEIEALFKSTLLMVFASYLIGIAFFFIMCKHAFTQQPFVGKMDFVSAPTPTATVSRETERKDRFHFVHEMKQNVALLGAYSMRLESHALLPLNGMKQLLIGSSEHVVETIHAAFATTEDIVLI